MIDKQSTGRRWGWPMLALLSLAALLAGAWWLASARPDTTPGFLQPRASQQPAQTSRQARPHPHPAAQGTGEAPRRRPPVQAAAGEALPSLSAGFAAQAVRKASAPDGEPEAAPARTLARQDARRQLSLKAWLPM